MARSTYYFEINKTDPVAIRNEELLLVIKKIFVENKDMGYAEFIWN
jgi:putative transposase